MSSNRSKFYAILFLLYAACVAAAVQAAATPVSEDGRRLAHAYHDVLVAEQSLREIPGAEATFGPMLREARARLEAGLSAAEQTGIAQQMPARSIDTSSPEHAPSGHESDDGDCAACSASALQPATTPAASNAGLPLRRGTAVRHLIWV